MWLPLLLAAALAAPDRAPARPEEIVELVDRARATAPEFAADALIRLASSEKVRDRAWKRELLDEAFQRASGAQQPFKKRAVRPERGSPADFLDRTFSQNLDACSLKCRAVRAFIPVDAARARELFNTMPPPDLPRLTCEDPLVYDVSAYYETLAEVVKNTFTAQEIEEDEPLKLLQARIGALQNPVQVEPVARLLTTAPLGAKQLEALVPAFAAALKSIAGDDRSFSFTVSRRRRVGPAMYDLVGILKRNQIGVEALVEAYRAFLVSHLRAARCADSSEPVQASATFGLATAGTPLAEAEQTPDAVTLFNESLRVPPIPRIEPEETEPAKVEGVAGGLRTCQSQECRDLVTRYRALLFGQGGMPLSNEQKAASEWQARLKEYLAGLAEWKADADTTAAEHFQQKCHLYSELVNVVPNGTDRETVLRAYLQFLKQNTFQNDSRAEWFLPVNSLIGRVFLDPLGLKQTMAELRSSDDAVISLYAALEALVPRRGDQILSLM